MNYCANLADVEGNGYIAGLIGEVGDSRNGQRPRNAPPYSPLSSLAFRFLIPLSVSLMRERQSLTI